MKNIVRKKYVLLKFTIKKKYPKIFGTYKSPTQYKSQI